MALYKPCSLQHKLDKYDKFDQVLENLVSTVSNAEQEYHISNFSEINKYSIFNHDNLITLS